VSEGIQRADGRALRSDLVRSGVASRYRVLRVVRATGWTLVLAGAFMLGFVAHQLWVTDFFAKRAQDGLQTELAARAEVEVVEVVPFDPDTGTVGPPVGTLPAAAADALPSEDFSEGVVGPEFDAGDYTVPGLDTDQFLLRESASSRGDAVGTIRIPEVGLEWAVVEGVTRNNLKSGAGHMPTTPLPGQPGNAVISGHRTTYGAPFHNLDQLRVGDLIMWDSPVLGTHTYAVRDSFVVRPTALWVTNDIAFENGSIEPAPSTNGAWLTLTTCHPKYSARQRYIVFAELVDGPNASAISSRS
jgi:sortase A